MTAEGNLHVCAVEDCTELVYLSDMCARHYGQWAYNNRKDHNIAEGKLCSIEGCGKPIYAVGLCSRHYFLKRRAAADLPQAAQEEETERAG